MFFIIFISSIISICLFIAIFFFIYIIKNRDQEKYENVLFFLDLDLKNWRIKKNSSLWNTRLDNEKFSFYFNKKIGVGWINIAKFFSFIGEKEEKRWRKAIEYSVQNKSNTSIQSEMIFKTLDEKKDIKHFFDIKFIYVNDKRIHIELKSKTKIYDEFLNKKLVSKKDLLTDESFYKLFVAFSLVDKDQKTFIDFVIEMDSILKIKNANYFKSNAIVVVVLKNNSYLKIKHLKRKIQKRIKKMQNNSIIKNLFEGSAFVECQNLKSESDFSKIMTRISFSLVKSKINKKPILFNQKNIKFNEFEEFKEKIMNISNIIETKEFEYLFLPTVSIQTKEKIYDYLIPNFKLEDDYWNDYVIGINDFYNKIRDKFAKNILSIKQIDYPKNKVLLSINDYQIEDIFDQMVKNKNKFIFIINRIKFQNVNEFVKLLKLLELSEIKYGISANEFDSSLLSIIGNVKPKIILISNKFNENFGDNGIKNKLKVIYSILLSERSKILLIFSNIDKDMAKEIQLLSKTEKYWVEKPPQYLM